MPGLLIDDMPFSLDPASPCSSLFFEPVSPSSPSYIYTQTQLSPFLSSFSVPAVDKQQQQQQQQQQQRSSITSLSLDSPLSSNDYPLWANASPRFHSTDSSSSIGSLGRSQGESAVKELLLEAAAMVAAAKGGGAAGSSGKKTSASTSQGVAAQPESPVAAALQKFLPSNSSDEAGWTADDVYSCDEFRMFEFKVRRCMRGRSHDWTECPFAHPGEKARRRDPRRFHYSGAACPDFRKGSCKNGDSCELAHGVFECWLHPARYRTQPCKDGRNCKRRVCFFAHTPEQLRLLPSATPSASPSSSVASSPKTRSGDKQHQHMKTSSPGTAGSSTSSWSPTSTLVGLGCSPPPLSPPLSPSVSPPHSPSASISSGSCTGLVARHTLEQSHSYQRRSSFSSTISSPPSSPGAGYHSAFSSPCASPKAQLSDLVSALHQLELTKAAAAAAANPLWLQQQQQQQQQQQAQGYSTGPSPLRPGLFTSRNNSGPCTPTKLRWDSGAMWEMDSIDEEDMVAAASIRLETGRDLRAKMYGRLASRKVDVFNDPAQDEGSPDLNWVNDLLVAE